VGLFRKAMSVGTLGIVSYRTKDQRAGRYARQMRNAMRAQVAQSAAQVEVARQHLAATDYANVREAQRDEQARYAAELAQYRIHLAQWQAERSKEQA